MFDIKLKSGRKLKGVRVQGNGGEIGADSIGDRQLRQHEVRLRGAVQMMTNGKRSSIYEPEPGHAKVYFRERKGDELWEIIEVIDLRGADVALAKK